MCNTLEHNLFNNVSNWVTFLWQTQIQTIKYGLHDTKRIKMKQVTVILYSFTCTPSDMNFQPILMPKVILAKILSKKSTQFDHSYLKYALDWTVSKEEHKLHQHFWYEKVKWISSFFPLYFEKLFSFQFSRN